MLPADAVARPVEAELMRHVFYVVRGRPGQNDRPCLPAGHPVTWGAITHQTTLEGEAYPLPVFLE